MIQVEVTKNKGESTGNLLRRFSKKAQGSGLLKRARSFRFYARPKSDFVRKKEALTRLLRQKEYRRLYKLGKVGNAFSKK